MSEVQNTQEETVVNEFFIPKKLFDVDTSTMKVFESKTGTFTGWDPKNAAPDLEQILTPEQFTVAIYARSQEAAASSNLSEKDKSANKYFQEQIAQSDDPDLFHLMMTDFAQWHELMEEMNYVHISRAQIADIFDKVYEIVDEYKKKKEAENAAAQ